MAQNKSKGNCVIVGCGFVGEHLLTAFAKSKDLSVKGFDISADRVAYLKKLYEIDVSTDEKTLVDADLYCISVPTLLKTEEGTNKTIINTSHIQSAIKMVTKYAKPESTVVIESSVAVGMSRGLMKDLREKGIYCGFSPERVDPGRVDPPFEKIPKVIAGYDDASLRAIKGFYEFIFERVVTVSSMETAEMCKLAENCFRTVNIAYANEISDACITLGINPDEMIDACSTKPFGYMKFTPGLGIGGHCIPVNPYYLFTNPEVSYPVLKTSIELMEQRPKTKAGLITKLYPEKKRILVVGMGFKVGDGCLSNSPGLALAQELLNFEGVRVNVYDPLVKESELSLRSISEKEWSVNNLDENFDLIVIAIKQKGVDLDILPCLSKCKVVHPQYLV